MAIFATARREFSARFESDDIAGTAVGAADQGGFSVEMKIHDGALCLTAVNCLQAQEYNIKRAIIGDSGVG